MEITRVFPEVAVEGILISAQVKVPLVEEILNEVLREHVQQHGKPMPIWPESEIVPEEEGDLEEVDEPIPEPSTGMVSETQPEEEARETIEEYTVIDEWTARPALSIHTISDAEESVILEGSGIIDSEDSDMQRLQRTEQWLE